MDSASFRFVFFGLVVASLSNIYRARAWRSAVLLISSFAFLALLARNILDLLPLTGFLLVGYLGLQLIESRGSTMLMWTAGLVIAAFLWLKKYTFLPTGSFLPFSYFTLGLSYIFFRVLQLLIEAAANANETRRVGLIEYLSFTLNFTTLVSGPIQHYDAFASDQFAAEPVPLGAGVIGSQLERIVRGLFKVNVLAMLLNIVRDDAIVQISSPILPISIKLLAGFRIAIVYPVFLYCNFSGYIDIVIAIARLMRLRLPENFDRPFSASSYLEFWNRWHMTLSTWFKTYVYNPLLVWQMRHVSAARLQRFLGIECFFITFFLVGIWHGSTSEFALFGLLQGAGVSINKTWQLWLSGKLGKKRYKALGDNFFYAAFGRGLTYTWLALSCFCFWADWKQILRIFAAVGAFGWLSIAIAVWFSAALILSVCEWLRTLLISAEFGTDTILTSRYARVAYASALGLTAVFTLLLDQPAPELVYKAF